MGNHNSGRKPQPDAVKAAKGETRPSRQSGEVVDFPVIDNTVPDPPEWMEKHGVELWNRITPLLYNQRILTEADLPALETMCALHHTVHKQLRAGMQPTAAEISQLRMYYSEFGLTPSSRTRVSASGAGDKGNGFNRNGRKGKA